jgi:dihydroorotase
MYGARMDSSERLMCELTVKDGRIVYDLNGISRPDWKTLPAGYGPIGDGRWDGLNPARGTAPGTQRGRGGNQ